MKHTPMGAGDTTVNSRETRAWPLARWDWSLAAEMGIWHLIVLREGRYKVHPTPSEGQGNTSQWSPFKQPWVGGRGVGGGT